MLVWASPVPVIVSGVPAGPLGGEKLAMVGVTPNCRLVASVVAPVPTVTGPVSAPSRDSTSGGVVVHIQGRFSGRHPDELAQ
jgi:hypothetical protein